MPLYQSTARVPSATANQPPSQPSPASATAARTTAHKVAPSGEILPDGMGRRRVRTIRASNLCSCASLRAQAAKAGSAVLNARGEIVGVLSSIVHDVRGVGIVALPESLPDYYSISTLIDAPARDVVGLVLGTRAE